MSRSSPTPAPDPADESGEGGVVWTHLLYLAPGLVIYAMFVLWPVIETFRTSFYRWDGITDKRWVGLRHYIEIFTDEDTLMVYGHGLVMIFFYAVLPVAIGLVIVSIMTRIRVRLLALFRTVLFLPQILATVVVAVAWRWIYAYDGPINGFLDLVGLAHLTRPWLGDFDTALPAVGLIGTWINFGLCMVLFIGGAQKIDSQLYEAARLDGAGPVQEFLAVTLPNLRGEITIALVMTVTNALRNFDIVWNTTSGGPGTQTLVPSYLIYEGAFLTRDVGFAAAASVTLTVVILALTGGISVLLRPRR